MFKDATIEELYSVFVEGLEFYGYHGASAEERSVGHRFVADVQVNIEARLPITDTLDGTVDYSAIAKVITRSATEKPFKMVEALSAHILTALFGLSPLIDTISLRVAKVLPPFPEIAKQAGVETNMTRTEWENNAGS